MAIGGDGLRQWVLQKLPTILPLTASPVEKSCNVTSVTVPCNITCQELLSSVIFDVCNDHLFSELERQQARIFDTAAEFSEASRSMPMWKLIVVLVVVASILYNHGRLLLWLTLSAALFAVQAAYAAWNVGAVCLFVWLYTVLRNATIVFYVCESALRWARGGSIRKRWRLRHTLRTATSWADYEAAGRELDDLDGKGAWRSSAGDGERSGYQSRGVRAAIAQLRAARLSGDAEELTRLLATMMQRRHLGVDRPGLFSECRVGTKVRL